MGYYYAIYGNYGYGHGYEEVSSYDTRKEASTDLRLYRENEPGVPFILKRHICTRILKFKVYGDGEFNSLIINAPDDNEAFRILHGMTGKNGVPEEGQYILQYEGLAYVFHGTTAKWKKAIIAGEVE